MNLIARSISFDILNSLCKRRNLTVVRFGSFQAELNSTHVLKRKSSRLLHESSSHAMVLKSWNTEEDSMDVCKEIFRKGVQAVHPRNLIRDQITRNGQTLVINQTHRIQLDKFSGVYVVGFGKAVLPMTEELLQLLGTNLKTCILSVPVGTRQSTDSRIEIHQGAKNNIPDEDAFKAAKRIVQVTSSCSSSDLLFVIISGGGSALLPFPKPPITLADKGNLVKLLSRAGADIQELNLVRRKISEVKGGGLLKKTNAGKVISLILSDVLGDDLDIIASGPTTVSHHAEKDAPTALQVIQKLVPPSSVTLPSNVLKVLEAEERQEMETDNQSERVSNIILGSNKLALDAAGKCAVASRYVPVILTSLLEGEASVIGTKIAQLCDLTSRSMGKGNQSDFESQATPLFKQLNLAEGKVNELLLGIYQVANDPKTNGLCLLLGGETTVKVTGSGIGGRNQELALSAAIKLDDICPQSGIVICSGGTDGIDGPCDAAGAVVTPSMVTRATKSGLCPTAFLRNNDSYNFFKNLENGKFHLVTGHTETNVMDMVICLIQRISQPCSPPNSSL